MNESSDERLFLRVVDRGSMKAVAAEIGSDPSTVSRRLAQLEDRLSVRLLNRSTRRTTTTDAGEVYAQGLRRLVDEVDALEAEVAGTRQTPRGRLIVTTPADFGNRFVVPVVGALSRDAPELTVELLLGSSFLDLSERGIDVAVRIGQLRDSALRARRLGEVPRLLVASPAFLDEHGRPKSPKELSALPYIGYVWRPDLSLTLRGPEGSVTAPVTCRFALNSMTGIREQVLAGAGFTYGPRWAFDDALADGRLEVVLPAYRSKAFPLHALYRPSAHVPAKVRVFIDRLAEACGAEPTLREG